MARFTALLAAFFCLCVLIAGAQASSLDREAMKALFPKPYSVGERDASLPVWPIFTQSYNGDVLVAYAFESIDFEPIPGFSGTPVNLLVSVKPSGELLDVRVLSQHEPVFVDGLGPEPLKDFVRQYAGKSLRQSIKIVPAGNARSALRQRRGRNRRRRQGDRLDPHHQRDDHQFGLAGRPRPARLFQGPRSQSRGPRQGRMFSSR